MKRKWSRKAKKDVLIAWIMAFIAGAALQIIFNCTFIETVIAAWAAWGAMLGLIARIREDETEEYVAKP